MAQYTKYSPGAKSIIIDWETSGSDFNGNSADHFQGLAFGAIVVDNTTWDEIDSVYCEMQFDGTKYRWSDEAQKIHGLTREYLATQNTREQACEKFMNLVLDHFSPNDNIMLGGHNRDFDEAFTLQLLNDFGLRLKFHHVKPDSSGLAFVLLGEYKSDVVFGLLAGVNRTGSHNALEDARAVATTFKTMKEVFALGVASLG